jgi:hypothetical protein
VKIRRSLLKDLVAVETYSGEGAYGPIFAAAVTVKVNVDQTRRLVRNTAGDEVVSEATFAVHPQPRDEATRALLDATTLFTPESQVTISGRAAKVISVKANTVRGRIVFMKVTTT